MTNYTIYRLFDYETGSYVGKEFSDVREFFEYHKKHTFKDFPTWGAKAFFEPRTIEYSHTGRRLHFFLPPRKPGMFQNRYAVRDELGRNYENATDLWELAYPPKPIRWGHYYDFHFVEPLIHLPKNNVNKMVPEVWSWFYRGVRTANEHRQNDAHIHEYEREYNQRFVRGSRRGYNLPTSWDDKPNSVWKTRKSWKHNSKRRHQWKK